jgi:tRNA A37 methylthiotransferase MiaB
LIEAYGSSKLYKFIHLPIQSGSDSVLRSMHRNYMVEEVICYMRELREKISGISIEADIIIGYSTETDADFEAMINFLEEIKPSITNVSKFSLRPHAPASRLNQPPSGLIEARSIEASRRERRMQYEEHSKLMGTVEQVTITKNARSSTGRDDYYMEVVYNHNL